MHYGSEPGSKFYSHLSDQYGYFSILPISPTESEAAYVLDGLGEGPNTKVKSTSPFGAEDLQKVELVTMDRNNVLLVLTMMKPKALHWQFDTLPAF